MTLWTGGTVLLRNRKTKELTSRSEPFAIPHWITDSLSASELMNLEDAISKWACIQFQSKEDFMSLIAEIKQQYEQFFKARFYFVRGTPFPMNLRLMII
jgi:hypothetical protein